MGYSGRKKEVSKSINLCWRYILSGIIIAVFVTTTCLGNIAMAQGKLKPVSEEEFKKGKDVYDKYCAVCHGEEGDGYGELAHALYPKPRDFTKGQYKIRTNATGSLPTDADLIHVISVGIHGTSMIPDRKSVV